MKTAKDIIKDLLLNMKDIAILTLETAEELGESAQGLTRLELLHLLRRVIRAGVKAVWSEKHTVSFEHVAYFRDLGALQLEMGHRSADLLRSRYLILPQVRQARVYWG